MKHRSTSVQPDLFEQNRPRAYCQPPYTRSGWQRWSKPCCSRSRRRWQARRSPMTKITADHLGRGAFVYIRQSTADQLLHNLESRRQYGLADRARQLGWTTVEVIDDDLGR